ncbi:MAG TPA: LysM peptidoglycan-binding domain-containing protein [Firmicutes bacterium]|jgi:LysM repeat protein|nr:LysM peptidoglycan-binding domain-containing protein [Bacillota bacterium]
MKKAIPAILIVLMLSMGAAAGAPQYHTTAKGDTVYGLAQRYGVTVAEFLEFNPGLIPENLRVGQKLLIPVQTLWSYHVVQPGDNSRSLAAQYRVPEDLLLQANRLSAEELAVGTMIRIPMHFYLGESAARKQHTVEIGDTLFKLALQYKVSLKELVEWNNLQDPNQITAGQVLIVG